MIKFFGKCLTLVLVVAIVLCCKKPILAPSPVISAEINHITLDYRQTPVSIAYSVKHANNEELTASSSSLWIEDVTVNETSIVFTVNENNSGYSRSATVTLEYPGAVPFEIEVDQSCDNAQIVLEPESAGYEYSGGTGSFRFEIQNPRQNSQISVSSRFDWIVDVEENGNSISYSVLENNSGADRTGTIVLNYGNNYSKAEFFVRQKWAAPIIRAANPLTYDSYGGSATVEVQVENPRLGVSITATTSCNWITGIGIDDNHLGFFVQENPSGIQRSGRIELLYGEYCKLTIGVNQQPHPAISMHLNKETISLNPGMTYRLIATVSPEDSSLEWTSSNQSVATVDSSGLVTTLSGGETIISVKSKAGGESALCHVTVSPATGGNEDYDEEIWK